MISIFNGSERGLEESGKQKIFLQVQVRMRRYLRYFGPFGWTVFTAIALHMNEDGWSWPGKDLLSDETGLAVKTIGKWVKRLDKLEIKGRRVLLHFQPKKKRARGHFDTNRYLLFPTKEELALYERGELEPPYTLGGSTARRSTVRRDAAERSTARRSTVGGKSHHVHEVEPSFKQDPSLKEDKTHTQPEAARQTAPDVGVSRSRFSLEQCREYALHLQRTDQGITNPGGYATAICRSGEADDLIEKFLNPPPDVSNCPDCSGAGHVYVDPEKFDKGVKRCAHPNLASVQI